MSRDLQEYWAERAHSKNELIEAGRELGHVYAGYEFQAQQTEALHAEIARLEQLLRLPSDPHYRFEPARVVLRDFSGWWQQLVIRKGANYDLRSGAPVVYSGGVVGRVREVHAYTADVDLVTSPRMRLAANIENDTRPVSYQGGDNPPLAPARGIVEFVPPGHRQRFHRPPAAGHLRPRRIPARPDHRLHHPARGQRRRPVSKRRGLPRPAPVRTHRGHRARAAASGMNPHRPVTSCFPAAG